MSNLSVGIGIIVIVALIGGLIYFFWLPLQNFQAKKTINSAINTTDFFIRAKDIVTGLQFSARYIVRNSTDIFGSAYTNDFATTIIKNVTTKQNITIITLDDDNNGDDFYPNTTIIALTGEMLIETRNQKEGEFSFVLIDYSENRIENISRARIEVKNLIPDSMIRYPLYCIAWSNNVKDVHIDEFSRTTVPTGYSSLVDKCFARREIYFVSKNELLRINLFPEQGDTSPIRLHLYALDRAFYESSLTLREGYEGLGGADIGVRNKNQFFELPRS